MRYSFDAIGTWWQVDMPEDAALMEQIHATIDRYDLAFSRFRSDSLVSKIAAASGEYVLPPEAKSLFQLYYKLYQLTNGLFTPLIGQTLAQAGYDESYTLKTKTVTAPPVWESVLQFEYPKVTTNEPVLLDVGAAGKGQLIDSIGDLLELRGVVQYCVDAGGDMRFRGNKPTRVGLEHPELNDTVVGLIEVANTSVCGSSGNRRKWGKYHHIINPKTKTSPKDILATWAIADTTMLADALSTCLFLVEPSVLEQEFSFAYAVLYADYSMKYSSRFPGEIFT